MAAIEVENLVKRFGSEEVLGGLDLTVEEGEIFGLIGPSYPSACRSPRISFHALQSLWYQVAWLVILAVGWTVTGLLTVIIIGFLLIPVMIVLTLVPFVHMSYAAYKVSQGVDYRYLWVADMVSSNRKLGS